MSAAKSGSVSLPRIPGLGIAKAACVGHPGACDDVNPCTLDTCHPLLGCVHDRALTGKKCDDGDPCTANDRCGNGGTCAGSPLSCDDGNPCTVDQCAPSTGECESTVQESALCDDDDPCTSDDRCAADGTCAGSAVTCDDGNPCTLDQCVAGTGECENAAMESAPCDDADACTAGDRCTASAVCQGVEESVDDGVDCTADSCDPQSGVAHDPVAAGTPCSDGAGDAIEPVCDGDGRCVGALQSESVVARVGGQDDAVEERRLGNGRHPVAASQDGFGVAFVEALKGGGARLGVATFSSGGAGRGLWRYDGVPYEADPVIAAVPGGFAVAFNAPDVGT